MPLNKESIGGVLFFLFGLFTMWETSQFKIPVREYAYTGIGPQALPYTFALLLIVLSVLLLRDGLKKAGAQNRLTQSLSPEARGRLRTAAMFAFLLVVTVALLDVLGFFAVCFLFSLVTPFLLGYRKVLPVLILAVVMTSSLYWLFVVFLSTQFPEGVFASTYTYYLNGVSVWNC